MRHIPPIIWWHHGFLQIWGACTTGWPDAVHTRAQNLQTSSSRTFTKYIETNELSLEHLDACTINACTINAYDCARLWAASVTYTHTHARKHTYTPCLFCFGRDHSLAWARCSVRGCWRCWCLTCENTGSTFYIWRRRCVRVRHKVIADAEGGIVKFSGGTRYHTYVKHSSATTSSLRPSNTPWPRLQILQRHTLSYVRQKQLSYKISLRPSNTARPRLQILERHTLSYVRQTQLEQHYQLDELFRDCGSHRS